MRFFKRFLKDKGCYNEIMRYIIPKNKSMSEFRDDVFNYLYLADYGSPSSEHRDFRDMLHVIKTVNPSYSEYGHNHWERNISPISSAFIHYCNDILGYNYIKYKLINTN
jgi:hypothetical protein